MGVFTARVSNDVFEAHVLNILCFWLAVVCINGTLCGSANLVFRVKVAVDTQVVDVEIVLRKGTELCM